MLPVDTNRKLTVGVDPSSSRLAHLSDQPDTPRNGHESHVAKIGKVIDALPFGAGVLKLDPKVSQFTQFAQSQFLVRPPILPQNGSGSHGRVHDLIFGKGECRGNLQNVILLDWLARDGGGVVNGRQPLRCHAVVPDRFPPRGLSVAGVDFGAVLFLVVQESVARLGRFLHGRYLHGESSVLKPLLSPVFLPYVEKSSSPCPMSRVALKPQACIEWEVKGD